MPCHSDNRGVQSPGAMSEEPSTETRLAELTGLPLFGDERQPYRGLPPYQKGSDTSRDAASSVAESAPTKRGPRSMATSWHGARPEPPTRRSKAACRCCARAYALAVTSS